MTIDFPRTEDHSALRGIWQEAFGDDDRFLDGFFRTGFSPRRCRCLRLEDQLAAVLYWFDCTWENKKLAYLYAVATDKAFRGRGLCRSLMEDTHRHLKALRYAGTALVPGSKGLFDLYKKLGYTAFCPMQPVWVAAGSAPQAAKAIDATAFDALRPQLLSAGSVLQAGDTTAYLAEYSQFYRTDTALMCLSRQDDTLYFQEYLGTPGDLPGIIAGLGAAKAWVRIPGGKPYAMFHSLTGEQRPPTYLGIPLD